MLSQKQSLLVLRSIKILAVLQRQTGWGWVTGLVALDVSFLGPHLLLGSCTSASVGCKEQFLFEGIFWGKGHSRVCLIYMLLTEVSHCPCLQEYQECAGGIICTCCESCSYAWLAEQSPFHWNQFPIALWTVHAFLVFTWRKMDQCLCDSAGRQSSSHSWEKVHSRVLPMSLWSVSLHLETTSNNPILPASTWGHSGNCWGCFDFLFCHLSLHF